MPYLSKLNVVKDLPNTHADPIKARGAKLIERLAEQIEMVEAMIAKKPLLKYHSVWVDDPDTGEKVKKQLPRKLNQWYYERDGIWYFQCKYGNRRLKLKNSMSTIKVGKLEKLIPTIQTIIKAVEAGEMDKILQDAYTRKIA